MHETNSLATVPDDELLRRLVELLKQARRVEADLVSHIAEVDARRLFARHAAPSMFAYCTQILHLSEPEAYLRIAAARASREHPVLLTMLADGRLHLSGIALLAPLLTPANRDALLARAGRKSKRQILELVAEISPRPDAPVLLRKLPASAQSAGTADAPGQAFAGAAILGSAASALDVPASDSGPRGDSAPASVTAAASDPGLASALIAPAPALASALPLAAAPPLALAPLALAPAVDPAAVSAFPDALQSARPQLRPAGVRRPAVVEPLAPGRYKVQFTASAGLRDKLERLRALMRSEVPDGDLAAIIERAVSEKLERLEARRFASTRRLLRDPAGEGLPEGGVAQASRHIPAAVRRAVHERDEGRCSYVDAQGRRCPERGRLEYHHRRPFGFGGDHAVKNISLMCPAHNGYLAECDYGRAAIDRHRKPRRPGPAPAPA